MAASYQSLVGVSACVVRKLPWPIPAGTIKLETICQHGLLAWVLKLTYLPEVTATSIASRQPKVLADIGVCGLRTHVDSKALATCNLRLVDQCSLTYFADISGPALLWYVMRCQGCCCGIPSSPQKDVNLSLGGIGQLTTAIGKAFWIGGN